MDDTQLKAALLDLAEYGFIFVATPSDAKQVLAALPDNIRPFYKMRVRLDGRYFVNKWRQEDVKRHKNHRRTRE